MHCRAHTSRLGLLFLIGWAGAQQQLFSVRTIQGVVLPEPVPVYALRDAASGLPCTLVPSWVPVLLQQQSPTGQTALAVWLRENNGLELWARQRRGLAGLRLFGRTGSPSCYPQQIVHVDIFDDVDCEWQPTAPYQPLVRALITTAAPPAGCVALPPGTTLTRTLDQRTATLTVASLCPGNVLLVTLPSGCPPPALHISGGGYDVAVSGASVFNAGGTIASGLVLSVNVSACNAIVTTTAPVATTGLDDYLRANGGQKGERMLPDLVWWVFAGTPPDMSVWTRDRWCLDDDVAPGCLAATTDSSQTPSDLVAALQVAQLELTGEVADTPDWLSPRPSDVFHSTASSNAGVNVSWALVHADVTNPDSRVELTCDRTSPWETYVLFLSNLGGTYVQRYSGSTRREIEIFSATSAAWLGAGGDHYGVMLRVVSAADTSVCTLALSDIRSNTLLDDVTTALSDQRTRHELEIWRLRSLRVSLPDGPILIHLHAAPCATAMVITSQLDSVGLLVGQPVLVLGLAAQASFLLLEFDGANTSCNLNDTVVVTYDVSQAMTSAPGVQFDVAHTSTLASGSNVWVDPRSTGGNAQASIGDVAHATRTKVLLAIPQPATTPVGGLYFRVVSSGEAETFLRVGPALGASGEFYTGFIDVTAGNHWSTAVDASAQLGFVLPTPLATPTFWGFFSGTDPAARQQYQITYGADATVVGRPSALSACIEQTVRVDTASLEAATSHEIFYTEQALRRQTIRFQTIDQDPLVLSEGVRVCSTTFGVEDGPQRISGPWTLAENAKGSAGQTVQIIPTPSMSDWGLTLVVSEGTGGESLTATFPGASPAITAYDPYFAWSLQWPTYRLLLADALMLLEFVYVTNVTAWRIVHGKETNSAHIARPEFYTTVRAYIDTDDTLYSVLGEIGNSQSRLTSLDSLGSDLVGYNRQRPVRQMHFWMPSAGVKSGAADSSGAAILETTDANLLLFFVTGAYRATAVGVVTWTDLRANETSWGDPRLKLGDIDMLALTDYEAGRGPIYREFSLSVSSHYQPAVSLDLSLELLSHATRMVDDTVVPALPMVHTQVPTWLAVTRQPQRSIAPQGSYALDSTTPTARTTAYGDAFWLSDYTRTATRVQVPAFTAPPVQTAPYRTKVSPLEVCRTGLSTPVATCNDLNNGQGARRRRRRLTPIAPARQLFVASYECV